MPEQLRSCGGVIQNVFYSRRLELPLDGFKLQRPVFLLAKAGRLGLQIPHFARPACALSRQGPSHVTEGIFMSCSH